MIALALWGVVFVLALSIVGSFLAFLLMIPLYIASIVVVTKDAKSRGMDGSAVWMLGTILLGGFTVLIYVLARPNADLIRCPGCRDPRPRSAPRCPHCGCSWEQQTAAAPMLSSADGASLSRRVPVEVDERERRQFGYFVLSIVGGALVLAMVISSVRDCSERQESSTEGAP